MALAPSQPIYSTSFLDPLQSTWSRFHGSRLQIIRYGLPNCSHKLYCSSSHNTINAESMEEKPKKIPRSSRETVKSQFLDKKHMQNSWIRKQSGTQIRNFQKRSQIDTDCRDGLVSSKDDGGGGGKEGFLLDWDGKRSSTMEKIVEKLKRFGYVDEVRERKERRPEIGSVDDIFYVEPGNLPSSRGGFLGESQFGVEERDVDDGEVRFPWEKPPQVKEANGSSTVRRSKTSLAELTLPDSELRRLKNLAVRTKERIKMGNAGVIQEIVDMIHEKWKKAEIVKVKCEGNLALNMKRTHEILERKTGGLVIWRSGSSVSLYRGAGYELPSPQPVRHKNENARHIGLKSLTPASNPPTRIPQVNGSNSDMKLVSRTEEKKDPESTEIKYEHEVDKLLEGLGPRFTDWPGCNPLPVDADLLPGVVPGFKPPFRILPYGVRYSLGRKDMTSLRRLARVLPPHFALGRSRQQQGLAVAMVKLWEGSSVAKIAFKRGVQLTCSERMAEEIKSLTGGTIVMRTKDFIVFYRGKDFLSPALTEALLERERMAKTLQEEEEQARLRASSSVISNAETSEEIGIAGTLGETLEADTRWGKRLDDEDKDKMMRAADVERHAALVRKLERKLALAEGKVMRAEKALAKVEAFLKPAERSADQETITDEERFMFRKLGLRMKAFLLLGRRGVFDGTVENMHLHWKYRELVKVIIKANNFAQVRNIALSLEAESGGVLVSVDKVSKGYAMVVFRGREYQRPPTLRPKNLLTKRKALARSIELQRREALCNHISTLQRRVAMLRSELDQMEIVEEHGDEELYAKLDSTYSTEDEDIEDEDDEAYLETYDSGDDEDDDDNVADDHRSPVWEGDANASNMYALLENEEWYSKRADVEKT